MFKIHDKPNKGPGIKEKPEELHSTYRCSKCEFQSLKSETLKSHKEAFGH